MTTLGTTTFEFSTEAQAKNRKAFVNELRSGKFEQGVGNLRQGVKFCPLGVACHLASKANPGMISINLQEVCVDPYKDEEVFEQVYFYDGEASVLPKTVQNWLGFADCVGRLSDGGSITGLNDIGLSFGGIAKAIEENETYLTRVE